MLDNLKDDTIKRFMLPDTLGILNPDQTFDFCKKMTDRYPSLHFDFHPHNDYDLAVANIFSAVKAGVKGVHTTINGLGERAGNAPLSSVIGLLRDQIVAEISVDEYAITKASKMVETFSGIRIPVNKPIIGENVFTQTSGVHADGDSKDNLYYNNLLPERFGRKRKYALGKQSGKATIKKNLEEFGLDLNPESLAKVTQRVIELGDKKENVTTEDLPFIISDVLGNDRTEYKIFIKNYSLSLSYGLKPFASVQIEIEGNLYQETSSGDGQYDAFMKAIRIIYDHLGKELPSLTDYEERNRRAILQVHDCHREYQGPYVVNGPDLVIGYEKGAAIAKKAYAQGRPIIEVAAEETRLGAEELKRLLDPAGLTEGGIKG
jgi:D-citramalate synthase